MERKHYISIGVTLALVLSAWGARAWLNRDSSDQPDMKKDPDNGQFDPDIQTQNGASVVDSFDSGNTTNTGETRINGQTGAIYYFDTTHPDGSGRYCIKLRPYTEGNKQTITGATTVLGEDPNSYHENPSVTVEVYGPNGELIGEHSTANGLPDKGKFSVVQPGTLVCPD